jgi:CelD/BcsL family acetyltransferase involved in cellulose biosynthesis
MPAPRLLLEGSSYDGWLAGLSRHRRAELKRRRRRLEAAGAVVRLVSDVDEIRPALQAFSALHHDRWKRRGGSGVLDGRVEEMLVTAAEELVPSSRLRLWCIEADGRTICSSLFVAAGGTLSYWLGGFDERWAQYGPAIETVRAALEHAWMVGDRVLDLGPGGQQYKYTFADGADVVHPFDLVPRTAGSTRARMWLMPEHAWARMKNLRYEAVRALSPGTQQRLKAIRRRLRSPR